VNIQGSNSCSELLVKENSSIMQGGSNMTGTDLCVNKLVTVPVIFEPPCTS